MSDKAVCAALSVAVAVDDTMSPAASGISDEDYKQIARAAVVQVLVALGDVGSCDRFVADREERQRIQRAKDAATSSGSSITTTFPQEISLRGCLFYKAEELHESAERAQLYETVDSETARAWTFVKLLDDGAHKYLLQPAVNHKLTLERQRDWQYIVVESAVKSRDRVPGPGGNRMVTSIRVLAFPKQEHIDKVYNELKQKQSGHLTTLEELRQRNMQLAKKANVVSEAERKADETESNMLKGRHSPISNPDEELPSRSPTPTPPPAAKWTLRNGDAHARDEADVPSTSAGVTRGAARPSATVNTAVVVRLELLDADALRDKLAATAAGRGRPSKRRRQPEVEPKPSRGPKRRRVALSDDDGGDSDNNNDQAKDHDHGTEHNDVDDKSKRDVAKNASVDGDDDNDGQSKKDGEKTDDGVDDQSKRDVAKKDDDDDSVMIVAAEECAVEQNELGEPEPAAPPPAATTSAAVSVTDNRSPASSHSVGSGDGAVGTAPAEGHLELFDAHSIGAYVRRAVRGETVPDDVAHRVKHKLCASVDAAVDKACRAHLASIKSDGVTCADEQERLLTASSDVWMPNLVIEQPPHSDVAGAV